ncbi:MAG: hypothetical protein Kow0083_11170 [Methylophaga sp.]|jgi:hypothetical protein
MVARIGLLAAICRLTRQARKGAAEPSDSGAEVRLVWAATLIEQGQRIADELSGSGPQVAT